MDIFNIRILSAIIIAGVMGTIINAVTVAIVISPDRLSLALVPGRYFVAIALCITLPFLYNMVSKVWFFSLGTLWLTLAASILAKFAFGVGAPWIMVLGFNFVYGVIAVIIYQVIADHKSKKTF